MALICFASQKGSPGTTLTALTVAAAWPGIGDDRRVFVEADRAGGALALRYGLGTDPGLLTLAAAVRTDPDTKIRAHAQPLPGGLPAVIAPDAPAQVDATLAAAGDSLGRWLDEQDGTAVADVGRLQSDGPAHAFLPTATTVAIVARPVAEQLQPAVHSIRSLGLDANRVGWVLIGEKPHGVAEVEATFGIPVLGVVAADPRTANALSTGSGGRRVEKSALVRSAASLAETLAGRTRPIESPAVANPNGVSA
ncbi:MAG: hypothetical protein AAF567_11980 [Actinomycetota bacterium]